MLYLSSNFHSKKRFGQNFLTDNNILSKILDVVSLSSDDLVLEIGPGRGILTQELAKRAKKVIAVELDKYLYNHLKPELESFDNIELVNCDILKFDLEKALKRLSINNKIKIVGNIPYSITSSILEYIFKNIDLLDSVYLMVQREFALRLVAKPNTKDYSSISCFTNFHVEPKLLFKVRRTCFSPQPKVDSCFIQLLPRQSGILPVKDKDLLFKVIRNAFNQRRKSILNSLSSLLGKAELVDVLAELNLDARLRAENLSLEDYIRISNTCFEFTQHRQ